MKSMRKWKLDKSYSASKPKDEVKSAFFLNIVVTNCSVILKPFSCKNESLLIGWNSFFCKDFLFYCSNVISVFNVQSNGFSCECSYEYLHSSPESEDKVDCAFLLDVVVSKSTLVFELLSCKNESLLIDWDSFFVCNQSFEVGNSLASLNFACHCLSCECSYEYLHSSPESEDKVDCAFLLDVVVSKSTLVFELLSCKNESLLIDWDSFFVCNQSFEVGNSLASLNFACHCLSCECLYEYLHVLFMIMNLIPFPPYLSISSNYY